MITHESWQKIKEIFHSAQAYPVAERSDFLDRICGDDASIREEVEALLTADSGNDDFLSIPAYEFAAGMLAGQETEFSAGQKVGRYTILGQLGSGGMGQIYLAQDEQLGRKIALKLISPQFAADARRVGRFEQEARAASALNHPNICVIHEVGATESGRHFIAMEYIQGTTLRDHLSLGTLSVRQALNITVQIAGALASAHASGIVHRDIKPENIMLRPDGYVKVLDFGLAKLTETDDGQKGQIPPARRVHTEFGMLMGTVKYMSPEQLRNQTVDERTDIWSLGVVFYEMLTGSTPFEAQTSNEIVAKILANQPTPLKFSVRVLEQLQDCIAKALQKDREQRYLTVTKFSADITRLRKLQLEAESEFDSYPVYADEQQTRKIETFGLLTRLKSQAVLTTDFIVNGIASHKKAALFAGATSVLALLLFLPGAARFINNLFTPALPEKMKRVTNAGTSVCSAISKDGTWVAHVEEQGGKQRLMLTNTVTSNSRELIAPRDVVYLGVTFTRDGNYLYFTRRDDHIGMLYRFPLPGGPPVLVQTDVDSPITFSPEQDRFAFVRINKNTSAHSLMISTIDGTTSQVLATRQNGYAFSLYGLAWSPDGNTLICPVSSWNEGYKVNLLAIDIKGQKEAKLIGDQSWFAILELAWHDDMSGLVMSAREQATSVFQLWRISYPDGVLQKITNDLADYRGVSLSGSEIVTVRTDWSWELTVSNQGDNFTRPTTITSGVGLNYGVSWAGDRRIVFSAMAQDTLNISRIEANGTNQVQLTTPQSNANYSPAASTNDNYSPAASTDGRYVVFSSNRTGHFNIWRMDVEDSSDLKQLTFTDGNFYPAISPDGQWVGYENQQSGQNSVWKVPLVGGNAIKVADRYRMPAFSPDNQLIAVRYDISSGTKDVAIFSINGGDLLERFEVPNFDWQRPQWISQNKLTYIAKVNGYPNIWSYERDTGARKRLTNFNRNQIFAYAWSPDRTKLACQLGTKFSNVVRIRIDR